MTKSLLEEAAESMKLAMEALAPLVAIADAYDANELDDEARKHWGPGPEHNRHMNETLPSEIELYSGRGGRQLLTLEHCLFARRVVRGDRDDKV